MLTAPWEKLKAGPSSPEKWHSGTCVVFTVHVLLLETLNFLGGSQPLIDRQGLF